MNTGIIHLHQNPYLKSLKLYQNMISVTKKGLLNQFATNFQRIIKIK